jgi:ribosomal protein L11 methyltransferase
VQLTLRASESDAPLVLAEACAAIGVGCREWPSDGTSVALDFWLPPSAVDGAERLCAELRRRGVAVELSAARDDGEWWDAFRAFHRPVEIGGRLRVRPPWHAPRPDLLDVVVDPGMAFGTGQHETTRACLELLVSLPLGPLVDVGCGSGVLAIAARRLGHDPVWALDADPLAVEATHRNARANGVALRVARRVAGRDPLPPAPTVLANLTATGLGGLARALRHAPPARAVLAGLRPQEADGALAAWAELGLRESARREADGWTTLLVGASG